MKLQIMQIKNLEEIAKLCINGNLNFQLKVEEDICCGLITEKDECFDKVVCKYQGSIIIKSYPYKTETSEGVAFKRNYLCWKKEGEKNS